jgi:hypothetical protein
MKGLQKRLGKSSAALRAGSAYFSLSYAIGVRASGIYPMLRIRPSIELFGKRMCKETSAVGREPPRPNH